MRSVNGPRQKAAYVNEDVIPPIEIVNCMEGSYAAWFPVLLRQDAKTSRERFHDQTANRVARLACIVYLNHEWNAAFSRPWDH